MSSVLRIIPGVGSSRHYKLLLTLVIGAVVVLLAYRGLNYEGPRLIFPNNPEDHFPSNSNTLVLPGVLLQKKSPASGQKARDQLAALSKVMAAIQKDSSPFKQTKDRLAIISYMPNQIMYVKQFFGLLYGSWKYIIENADKIVEWRKSKIVVKPDLLVFCHPSICDKLPPDCYIFPAPTVLGEKYKHLTTYPAVVDNADPTCWYVPQSFEVTVPYTPLNSFVMFNRSDIASIGEPYTYLLRTDIDCFLSPQLLLWKTPNFLTVGSGGYCDPFNMKRLKEIAHKLNMTHRGVHCVGSTWYATTDVFIKLAKKTLEMTAYMFINEFDPKAPGLETIDFKKNREGEWIRWWRPVSLLYGGELAINHLIDNFNQSYKQPYDASSCSDEPVWKFAHIHCWHNPCEFSKFTFMDMLNRISNKGSNVPSEVAQKMLKYSQYQDIHEMKTKEFCTYIAWNSVINYMGHLLS